MSRNFRITGTQVVALIALLGILLSAVGSAVLMTTQSPSVTPTPIVSSEVTTVSSEVAQ